MENLNLYVIFATGLFAGGLTCLAVQGGLLATLIAQRQGSAAQPSEKRKHAFPLLIFLIAKLAAYVLLGFALGWLGGVFGLSLSAKVIMQFAVAIFMLGTALALLDVHPIFRYFMIQPPKFLTRLVRNESKSRDVFAPAILGAFTVFIPCGTTQAMMALAIASGSPITGAAILFSFVLGTWPLFFGMGYMATRLGAVFQKNFFRIAAFAVIFLALFNLNNAIALTGSSWTLENLAVKTGCAFVGCGSARVSGASSQAVTEATIEIVSGGYSPQRLAVPAGQLITLRVVNVSGRGCEQAFTIPKLGIERVVPLGASDTVTFTAPDQPGSLAFMCGMGMYRGVIDVL
ncbi:MAG: sulfite exporter TauE/SafE family protein [Patescibacteria group bacterium]